MAANFIIVIGLGIIFRFLGYVFMHVISSPKRPKLNEKKKVKGIVYDL
jgi:hypothetical protein